MRHALLEDEVQRPEFAKAVGVTKPTIMNWIKRGKIRANKIGSRYYIPQSELTRIAQESTQVMN